METPDQANQTTMDISPAFNELHAIIRQANQRLADMAVALNHQTAECERLKKELAELKDSKKAKEKP